MHRYKVRWSIVLAAFLVVQPPALRAGEERSSSSLPPVTLVLSWQLEHDAAPEISVDVQDGRIVAVEPTASPSTPPFTLVADQQGRQRIRWQRPSTRGQVGLLVAAKPSSSIEVGYDGKVLRTSLLELTESPASIRWNAGELRVERPASDIVRVRTDHPNLILKPHEELNIQFAFYLLSPSDRAVPVQIRLGLAQSGRRPLEYPIDGRYRVVTNEPERAKFNLRMRAPGESGVYEIVLQVRRETGPGWHRRVPFVVVSPDPPPPSRALTLEQWWAEGKLLASAEAVDGEWHLSRPWWGWLDGLRSLMRRSGPQVASAEEGGNGWVLNLQSDDAMYVLELRAEGDAEPVLQATLEPVDGEGPSRLVPALSAPINLVLQPPSVAGIGRSVTRTRLLLPGSNTTLTLRCLPLLSGGGNAEWRIYQVPPIRELVQTFPSRLPDLDRGRIRAAYLADLRHLFLYGGVRTPSQWEDEPASSWTALYRAADGLACYARVLGADAVFLPVTLHGKSMWPAKPPAHTATWDPDRATSSLGRLPPKDAPELFFRVLARYRLHCIPVFEFGTRHQFNPLDKRSTARALAIVADFVAHYQHNTNFPALAVRLSPLAGTCLADLYDGLNDEVLGQFASETGLKMPPLTGDALRNWVVANARDRLIQWRCARIAQFIQQLLHTARSAQPQRKLIVILDLSDPKWTRKLRSAVHRGSDFTSALQECGISFAHWPTGEDLILCRPFVDAEQTVNSLWLNRAESLNDLFRDWAVLGGIRGPERTNGGEGRNAVLGPDHDELGLGGIRMLAQLDAQWVIDEVSVPLVPNELLDRELERLIRTLPRGKGVTRTRGPVIVRQWTESQVRRWLVVNRAPYPVVGKLTFAGPGQVRQEVVRRGMTTEIVNGSEVTIRFDGETFVLLAAPASTELERLHVELPPASRNYLHKRFRELMNAVSILRDEMQVATPALVPDGGFEQSAGMAPKWEFTPASAATVTREAAHTGEAGLRVTAPQPNHAAYVLSWPFTIPPGAEVLVRFHARAVSGPAKLSAWLVAADAPKRGAVAYTKELATEWKEHEIRIHDLAEGQWSWRLVFEIHNGTVDIDDVEVRARTITPEERNVMIKSLAPAVKAWYEKRWNDFSSITSGYWPQYLLRRFRTGQVDRSDSTP